MRIIDVHQHFGLWPFSMGWDAEKVIKHLRKVGVEMAIGSSPEALCYDFRIGNEEVRRIVERHEELLGYVVLNPNYPELSLKELEKYRKNPRFIGVKIHPDYHRQPLDSENYIMIYEQIERVGWPVLSHTNPGDPPRVRNIVERFKNLIFIMGHAGTGGLSGYYKGFREAAKLAGEKTNIYLEISTMPQTRIIENFVAVAGSEKVIFGSDFPLDCPSFMYPMVTEANITNEDKEKILHLNAERLFKLL